MKNNEYLPEEIYKAFVNNDINNKTALNLLVSIIEEGEDEYTRESSLNILETRLGLFNIKVFDLSENLLLSDSNSRIRNAAARILKNKFLFKAIPLFKWVLQHESDLVCLITITESLVLIKNKESKIILLNELKKIMKLKWINKEKRIENNKHRRNLKRLFKTKKISLFTQSELSEILINYFVIKNLSNSISNVFFELDASNGLISELDLSDDLEYEVKGTPWGWKNNIKSISDIEGLNYLKNLKKINFTNNQIENLDDISFLKNITHLILTNNNLSNKKNIDYLKNLPKLEYLDLRGNDIVNKIHSLNFDSKLRVLLKDEIIIK